MKQENVVWLVKNLLKTYNKSETLFLETIRSRLKEPKVEEFEQAAMVFFFIKEFNSEVRTERLEFPDEFLLPIIDFQCWLWDQETGLFVPKVVSKIEEIARMHKVPKEPLKDMIYLYGEVYGNFAYRAGIRFEAGC